MRAPQSGKGFTLLELLVVIAIIGILTSIVFAAMNSSRDKGKTAAVKQELSQLRNAINMLVADTGYWPGGKTVDQVESGNANEVWNLSAGAAGLVTTNGTFPAWSGPYIRSIPNDPWGNPYFLDTDYQVDEEGHPCQSSCDQVVAIGSFGPNGTGQNVYDADDIILILAW